MECCCEWLSLFFIKDARSDVGRIRFVESLHDARSVAVFRA